MSEKYASPSSSIHLVSPTPTASRSGSVIAVQTIQLFLSVLALVFASLALDRTLITGSATFEEVLLVLAVRRVTLVALSSQSTSAIATVAVQHAVQPRTSVALRRLVGISAAISAVLLGAATIAGAVSQGSSKGSCAGPAKIGVYNNHRACGSALKATVFAGLDLAAFGTALTLHLVQRSAHGDGIGA